jgi:hypothetical protein
MPDKISKNIMALLHDHRYLCAWLFTLVGFKHTHTSHCCICHFFPNFFPNFQFQTKASLSTKEWLSLKVFRLKDLAYFYLHMLTNLQHTRYAALFTKGMRLSTAGVAVDLRLYIFFENFSIFRLSDEKNVACLESSASGWQESGVRQSGWMKLVRQTSSTPRWCAASGDVTWSVNRVARLGEVSPIGKLFTFSADCPTVSQQ